MAATYLYIETAVAKAQVVGHVHWGNDSSAVLPRREGEVLLHGQLLARRELLVP